MLKTIYRTHKEQGPDHKESAKSYLCWSLLNMHVTFDLLEIKKTLPRGLNIKEATRGRAGDKLL